MFTIQQAQEWCERTLKAKYVEPFRPQDIGKQVYDPVKENMRILKAGAASTLMAFALDTVVKGSLDVTAIDLTSSFLYYTGMALCVGSILHSAVSYFKPKPLTDDELYILVKGCILQFPKSHYYQEGLDIYPKTHVPFIKGRPVYRGGIDEFSDEKYFTADFYRASECKLYFRGHIIEPAGFNAHSPYPKMDGWVYVTYPDGRRVEFDIEPDKLKRV